MATNIIPRKMSAEIDGDFVVFLIGMRINKIWKVHKWWPVFQAMRPMLKELVARPEFRVPGLHVRLPGDRPVLALV